MSLCLIIVCIILISLCHKICPQLVCLSRLVLLNIFLSLHSSCYEYSAKNTFVLISMNLDWGDILSAQPKCIFPQTLQKTLGWVQGSCAFLAKHFNSANFVFINYYILLDRNFTTLKLYNNPKSQFIDDICVPYLLILLEKQTDGIHNLIGSLKEPLF